MNHKGVSQLIDHSTHMRMLKRYIAHQLNFCEVFNLDLPPKLPPDFICSIKMQTANPTDRIESLEVAFYEEDEEQ